MPRSIELLSAHPGFEGVSVERGAGGAEPGAAATYVAMCHFSFRSAEDFLAAFMPHAAELQGDMRNYTDIDAGHSVQRSADREIAARCELR